MNSYPCVYMRGGTSKAIFFHEKDLPKNRNEWEELFLGVMGTPDVKQIDGMGGTVSSTSKVAVISPSEREDVDVNYNFFQVDIVIPRVDDTSNCGNISSAVGPFAIDEGLVEAIEPITIVRVLNTNTQKIIEQHVRVKDGKALVYGDIEIKGVPGTGSKIDMYFEDPAGAATGKLFPTGNKRDVFSIPDHGDIEMTVIDCANPIVFVRAEDIGLKGTELTEINSNPDMMEFIERIRAVAAEKIGLVENWEEARRICTSIPKVSIISKPQDYTNMDGDFVKGEDMELCCRAISVGNLHKAYPMTAAIATGAAVRIPGTLVYELLDGREEKDELKIGHSSGVMTVDVKFDGDKVIKGGVIRTARRIMEGRVFVRKDEI